MEEQSSAVRSRDRLAIEAFSLVLVRWHERGMPRVTRFEPRTQAEADTVLGALLTVPEGRSKSERVNLLLQGSRPFREVDAFATPDSEAERDSNKLSDGIAHEFLAATMRGVALPEPPPREATSVVVAKLLTHEDIVFGLSVVHPRVFEGFIEEPLCRALVEEDRRLEVATTDGIREAKASKRRGRMPTTHVRVLVGSAIDALEEKHGLHGFSAEDVAEACGWPRGRASTVKGDPAWNKMMARRKRTGVTRPRRAPGPTTRRLEADIADARSLKRADVRTDALRPKVWQSDHD